MPSGQASNRPQIVVLGANGQVGSEVCLLLHLLHADARRVVGVCRSRTSAFILERAGIEIREGDVGDSAQARELLACADVVVDLSLPRGLPSQFRAASVRIFDSPAQHAPRIPWIYASTIMALGMPNAGGYRFGWRFFPRTIYGANKRYAERALLRRARRCHALPFVLRLGQVHGALQGVSYWIEHRVRERPWEKVCVPTGASYAVFCVTIADAIAKIAARGAAGGGFTMLPDPPWSWQELAEYYCGKAGLVGIPIGTCSARRHTIMSAFISFARGIAGDVWRRLPGDMLRVFASELFSRCPAVEKYAVGRYYRQHVPATVPDANSLVLFDDTYYGVEREGLLLGVETKANRVRQSDAAIAEALSSVQSGR